MVTWPGPLLRRLFEQREVTWSAYLFGPLHSKYDAHSDFPGICI